MSTEVGSAEGQLVFVDAVGGSLAAMAAGVARSLGYEGAVATTMTPGPLAKEVTEALMEVGMRVPAVTPSSELPRAGATVIAIGEGDSIDCSERWPGALYAPSAGATSADDFALERMSTARIFRDSVERRLEARRAR
jgi:hypothetical protein